MGLCVSQVVSVEYVVLVCAGTCMCGLWCVWSVGGRHKSAQAVLLSSSFFSVFSWAPSSGIKAPLATQKGRDWQTSSEKDRTVNILGSVHHMVSVITIQLFHFSLRVAIDKM